MSSLVTFVVLIISAVCGFPCVVPHFSCQVLTSLFDVHLIEMGLFHHFLLVFALSALTNCSFIT